MSEQVDRKGKHIFVLGSDSEVVGSYTFYVHREKLRIVSYSHDNLKHNLIYKSLAALEARYAQLKREAHKEYVDSIKVSHKLGMGVILVSNSDLNSIADNRVSFYQVVDIVNIGRIKVREIEAEVQEVSTNTGSYKTCIPLPGKFIGEPEEYLVIQNSIRLPNGKLATRLPYQEINIMRMLDIKQTIKLKVYEPQKFGMELKIRK